MTDRTFTVRLRAVADTYEKVLNSAAATTDRMALSAEKLAGKADRIQIGKNMTKQLTVPVLGAGLAIVKVAGDYEASMREIQALTGASASEMDRLSGQAKKMGAVTQFSAKEAADAMVQLIKGGFDAEQAYTALPAVMQLAASAGLDIASAADIATNVLSSFGMQIGDLAKVNDVLSQAANASDTDVTELGEAMKMVGPIARAQNMSLEQTTGILAQLAENGIRGTAAGTALRGMIGSLLAPSKAAADVMRRLGVSVLDVHGNLLPMTQIVKAFSDAGATSADIYNVFGREVAGSFQALVGSGAPALEKMTTLLEDSNGVAQNLADAKMGGLSGSVEQLTGSMQGLIIAMGEAGASDFISSLAMAGTGLANALGNVNPMVLKFGMGLVAVAAASGPVIWAAAKMGTIYGPVVDGLQGVIGKFQMMRVQMALGRAEGLSTGQAMAASFGPQAAVLVGVAALAGVLYLAHKKSQEFAASHIAAGDAAMDLAKSAGIATKEIGSLADAQERGIVTADDFRLANEDAIKTLRGMVDDKTKQAFLMQIGYELVLRGAKPEEAIEQVKRLAAAAGVKVPVTMTVDNVDDFDTQLKALKAEATGFGKEFADQLSKPKGVVTSNMIPDLDRMAKAATDALNTQGPEAYSAALATVTQNLGGNTEAIDYFIDKTLELSNAQGLSTNTATDAASALKEMSSEASSLGQEQKDAIKHVLELAGAMKGGLTPANILAASAQVASSKSASDYAGAATAAAAAADELAGAGDGVAAGLDSGMTAADEFAAALKRVAGNASLSTLELDANASAAQAFSKSLANSSNVGGQLSAGLGVGSALHDIRKGLFGEGDAADVAAKKTKKVSDAADKMGDSFAQTDPKMSSVAITLGTLGAAADAYRESIKSSTSGMQDQITTALDLGDAYKDFRHIVKALPENFDAQGAALGRYKPRQRDAINNLAQLGTATTEYLSTLLSSGRGAAYVRSEAKRLTAQYEDQMRQAGLSEDAIGRYINMLGTTPAQVETAIKLSGEAAARFQIQSYLSLLEGRIPESVSTSVAAKIDSGDLAGAASELGKWAKTNPQKIDVTPEVDPEVAKDKMVLPHQFDPLKAALGGYTEAEQAGIEALQKLGTATQEYLTTLVGAGEPEEARKAADLLRQSYHDQLEQLGLTEPEIQSYLDMLGLTPEQVNTAITVSGDEEARFKIDAYTSLLADDIPPETKTQVLALIDEGKLAEAAALLAAWRAAESAKPITPSIIPKIDPRLDPFNWIPEQGTMTTVPPSTSGRIGYDPKDQPKHGNKQNVSGQVITGAQGARLGLIAPGMQGPFDQQDRGGNTWTYDPNHDTWKGRANGGKVVPGETYNVLERGRAELFTPTIPGTITPVNQLMTPATSASSAQIDAKSLDRLAALIPPGGDSYDVKMVTPNPRRSAEDLVRSTGSAKWRKTGRR